MGGRYSRQRGKQVQRPREEIVFGMVEDQHGGHVELSEQGDNGKI